MILDFGFGLGFAGAAAAAAAAPASAASLCSSSSSSTVVFTLSVARDDENLNLRLPSPGSTGSCGRSAAALEPASNASNTSVTSDRRTCASPWARRVAAIRSCWTASTNATKSPRPSARASSQHVRPSCGRYSESHRQRETKSKTGGDESARQGRAAGQTNTSTYAVLLAHVCSSENEKPRNCDTCPLMRRARAGRVNKI